MKRGPEKNPTNEQFGHNLRKYREAKGLSRLDVADICNVGERSLYKWEHGQVPSATTIMRLCIGLNVSPEKLFKDTGISYDFTTPYMKKQVIRSKIGLKLNSLSAEQLSSVLLYIDNISGRRIIKERKL